MLKKNMSKPSMNSRSAYKVDLYLHLSTGEVVEAESDWITPFKLVNGLNTYIKFLMLEKTVVFNDITYSTNHIVKIGFSFSKKTHVRMEYINANPIEWKYRYIFNDSDVEVDNIESV